MAIMSDSQPFLIKDVEHLEQLAKREGGVDCFIQLNYARSSKHITWTGESFDIFNEIDDTWQTLKPKSLWRYSNIGEALDKAALFARS